MGDPNEPGPAESAAEDLDEDRLRLDPLEEGMDPPEHWTQADRYGNTEAEQLRGESLDERLRQEEPELAELFDDELDEGLDGIDVEVEPLPADEPRTAADRAVERGQAADEAGGSVAEDIRTPHDRAR